MLMVQDAAFVLLTVIVPFGVVVVGVALVLETGTVLYFPWCRFFTWLHMHLVTKDKAIPTPIAEKMNTIQTAVCGLLLSAISDGGPCVLLLPCCGVSWDDSAWPVPARPGPQCCSAKKVAFKVVSSVVPLSCVKFLAMDVVLPAVVVVLTSKVVVDTGSVVVECFAVVGKSVVFGVGFREHAQSAQPDGSRRNPWRQLRPQLAWPGQKMESFSSHTAQHWPGGVMGFLHPSGLQKDAKHRLSPASQRHSVHGSSFHRSPSPNVSYGRFVELQRRSCWQYTCGQQLPGWPVGSVPRAARLQLVLVHESVTVRRDLDGLARVHGDGATGTAGIELRRYIICIAGGRLQYTVRRTIDGALHVLAEGFQRTRASDSHTCRSRSKNSPNGQLPSTSRPAQQLRYFWHEDGCGRNMPTFAGSEQSSSTCWAEISRAPGLTSMTRTVASAKRHHVDFIVGPMG
uniref:Uncharacterized protein n=1 Tax=Anopheles atroparvus TaxID=41427 RepID=A0A182ILG9_ANOAO